MGQFSDPVATHPRTNEVEVPPGHCPSTRAIHSWLFDQFYLVLSRGGERTLPYWAIRDVPRLGSPFSAKIPEPG